MTKIKRKVGGGGETVDIKSCKVSNEVAHGVSELYLRFNCNYCQEDIPSLRIKCAECSDFDLCLRCFACGAVNGKHKNFHKYIFMNNGGFNIFPDNASNVDPENGSSDDEKRSKRSSTFGLAESTVVSWNAREDLRLLDAVEQYGYGNWKDIARHIESKTPEQAKEQYIKHYIHGVVGKHTWKEELRGLQTDHTQAADRGPLSPTLTSKLPPISVNNQEAMLLGYMPHRDDFEDFDKETENLVSQIADKSVEDEDVDVALKLAQCDIYERRLREQVRRKRVARDYQLVSKFYRENPIVQIGGGNKLSPTKISSQVKAVMKKGDGPKAELMESFKTLTQFLTAQELDQLINNICAEKELKVRIKELIKYREHGLTKVNELVDFEKKRFKREFRNRRLTNKNKPIIGSGPRLLPIYGDYSIKAICNPFYHENESPTKRRPIGTPIGGGKKKRAKKSKWSRKKKRPEEDY